MRNARVSRQVTLTRGRRSETVGVVELGAEESLPVLRQYLREVRVARPYFDVNEDSPPEAFMAEAPRHPVFRISKG